jgi:hypothetical protein
MGDREPRSVKTWIVVFFFASATLFCGFDLIGFFLDRARDFRRWPKASATLVRYETAYTKGAHYSEALYRIYRYRLDGRDVEAKGPNVVQTLALRDIPEGATVEIAYNPRKPDEVLSKSDATHIPSRVGLIVQVLVFALVTYAGVRYALRRR